MITTISKTTESGIEIEGYKSILLSKQSVYTEAILWKIPRSSGKFDFSLKISRYNKENTLSLFPDQSRPTPKVELTLDSEELTNLVDFLRQCYAPLLELDKFIPLDSTLGEKSLAYLRLVISDSECESVLTFLADNNILPDEVVVGLDFAKRKRAVDEFELLLNEETFFQAFKETRNIKQDEGVWQKWFTENPWVLGTEFSDILTERELDPKNITDFLMRAYDGFVDLIEIKRSNGLEFWMKDKDHGNRVPSTDLIRAITQSANYVYKLEQKANDADFQDRLTVKTIKPRIVLIFGRSNKWGKEEKEGYRILNASYHNISIMTYDHVLERAKRILGRDDNPLLR